MRDHFESRDDEEGETGAIITRERHRRHIEKYTTLPVIMPLRISIVCHDIIMMVLS